MVSEDIYAAETPHVVPQTEYLKVRWPEVSVIQIFISNLSRFWYEATTGLREVGEDTTENEEHTETKYHKVVNRATHTTLRDTDMVHDIQ